MALENNPLILKSNLKYGAIPFNEIKLEHFMPALEYSINQAEKNLEQIINNREDATFENTILKMENGTELMENIAHVYFNLMGAESDNKFKELAQQISPLLSKFSNKVLLNSKLFKRIQFLYDNINEISLNDEQKRLVKENYNDFINNGALLNEKDKEKIQKIDSDLSKLQPQFSQNTLNSTNSFNHTITNKEELSGLPSMVIEHAATVSKEKGNQNGWTFTLQMPSFRPIMQYAQDRSLREKMMREFGKIAYGGEYDNQKIIKQIVSLRYEKAQLLGFKDHAEKTLQKRMAKKTETVMNFLNELFEVYYPAAKNELHEMQTLAQHDGINNMEIWDLAYYAEKLKKEKFDFNEEDLRPYFESNNVIQGVFKVAELMYDLKFVESPNTPTYHEEVKVFDVLDKDDNHVALFYIDLHPRKTKNGGAWMTCYRTQGLNKNGTIERPLISIVANLTPSTKETPALLTYDEVKTIFHEFGHALHGMLSNVTYKSLASPNVLWDFVELPSQIMENWLGEKETLQLFAKHYETGEIIPDSLIEKIKTSSTFNAGINGLRQLTFGFLDMAWHTGNPNNFTDEIENFENEAIGNMQLLPKIKNSSISCHLGHIFSGGYSAGYYSYKWAEALDADAFEHFKQNGIFNKQIATSFRKNILEKGNTEDPMKLYVKFKGKEPDSKALLRRDQLI